MKKKLANVTLTLEESVACAPASKLLVTIISVSRSLAGILKERMKAHDEYNAAKPAPWRANPF